MRSADEVKVKSRTDTHTDRNIGTGRQKKKKTGRDGKKCEISGSIDEDSNLLGSETGSLGKWCPTFRRHYDPSKSQTPLS